MIAKTSEVDLGWGTGVEKDFRLGTPPQAQWTQGNMGIAMQRLPTHGSQRLYHP